MENNKLPYEKAVTEIIDLSGMDDFFRASGGDSCWVGGSQDGFDNDG